MMPVCNRDKTENIKK